MASSLVKGMELDVPVLGAGESVRLLLGDREEVVLWRLEQRLSRLLLDVELRPVRGVEAELELLWLNLLLLNVRGLASGCVVSNKAFVCRKSTLGM